jgi:hypothetical protein
VKYFSSFLSVYLDLKKKPIGFGISAQRSFDDTAELRFFVLDL